MLLAFAVFAFGLRHDGMTRGSSGQIAKGSKSSGFEQSLSHGC